MGTRPSWRPAKSSRESGQLWKNPAHRDDISASTVGARFCTRHLLVQVYPVIAGQHRLASDTELTIVDQGFLNAPSSVDISTIGGILLSPTTPRRIASFNVPLGAGLGGGDYKGHRVPRQGRRWHRNLAARAHCMHVVAAFPIEDPCSVDRTETFQSIIGLVEGAAANPCQQQSHQDGGPVDPRPCNGC